MEKKSDFEEQKKIIDLRIKYKTEKHLMHMKELEFIRESDELHHEREMVRQRIKSAEIRRTQERKKWGDFHRER